MPQEVVRSICPTRREFVIVGLGDLHLKYPGDFLFAVLKISL
jgi:hypothetical protein